MSSLKERVVERRKVRDKMLEQFGFIPKSVLSELNRGALSRSMFKYQNQNPKRGQPKRNNTTGADYFVQHEKEGESYYTASIMPAELVDFFVNYYTEPGDVYLDPFAGQGIQMQIAKRRGLHYYGYDICREFFDYFDAVRQKIDDGETTIEVTCADSRHPDTIPDGIGDFSFHSPPYWDVEYYGAEPEQLGNLDYDAFLASMEDVYRAWLPKFKPGGWHVVNVNDFRRKGRFYTYHADTIAALRGAGWIVYDLWVIAELFGMLSRAFGVMRNESKIAPKSHEYAIVTRAPE